MTRAPIRVIFGPGLLHQARHVLVVVGSWRLKSPWVELCCMCSLCVWPSKNESLLLSPSVSLPKKRPSPFWV